MRMWGAAAAAIAIVVGAACGGGSKADPPAATTVAPTTAPSSKFTVRVTTTTKRSTPPPPYSFDNSVPPPELVNTGKPRPEIVSSFTAYLSWLDAHHPDPTLASSVAALGSRAFGKLSTNLAELAEDNTRLYEIKTAPDEIEIVNTTPTAFTARVVQHLESQQLTKESGRVTSKRTLNAPVTYLVLFAGSSEKWELVAIDQQS